MCHLELLLSVLPQNPKLECFLYFMNEKCNKNAKSGTIDQTAFKP